LNYLLGVIGLEAAAEQATENTGGMFGSMNSFFGLFTIAIGIFALYSAFTGKGPAYNNDYPKAMKEDANKLLRLFMWIFGPVLTITGVLDYMGYSWAYFVSMAVVLPGVVVYVVIFRRRFKKYLKK
jgi:hypothetical protein